MLARKKELLKDGIPSDSEHAMVGKVTRPCRFARCGGLAQKSVTGKVPARGSSGHVSKRESHPGR
jgi:hypothetical protein